MDSETERKGNCSARAPRWESEWIDPHYLKNELIGRCHNALRLLPKSKRPKSWSKIIEKEMSGLETLMLAFFAGPMDDFIPHDVSIQQKEVFKRVKSILRRRKSFNNARGLVTIAYTGAVGEALSDDVLRLLERSDADLITVEVANSALRCCAYIAANNRSEKLAKATTLRCLRLVTSQSSAEDLLRLILIGVTACAAYSERRDYYKAVSEMMSNFAFRTSQSAAPLVRSTLEILHRHDGRMISTLGPAMAILDVTIASK